MISCYYCIICIIFILIIIIYDHNEKAIEIALEMLETDGVELKPQPADPVRVLYKNGR
ncbi:MAG: hypothetical protein KAI95_03490 [Bacteroidales bacterium]|nr:hypothetical protein [Bacteroidales bacterium]